MALGDARRASGKAMEGARRAIGTTNEAERRAIGKAMEASRRGTTVDDINAVVTPPRPAKTLPEVQSRGALPAATGSADFKPRATTSTGGGGIASPLVEKTKVVEGKTLPDREYWEGGLPSTDGLLIYPAVKTFNLTDATGADVQLQLANPAGA